MNATALHLRTATEADLAAINQVVEAAVAQWDLPERVKRLSLSTYRYTEADFHTFGFIVAEDAQAGIVGVAAWEPAASREVPERARALLLHGLYVSPPWQGRGVGSALFDAVERVAREQAYEGILVKAQSGAGGFFRARHMQRLAEEQDRQQYAHRYWKALR